MSIIITPFWGFVSLLCIVAVGFVIAGDREPSGTFGMGGCLQFGIALLIGCLVIGLLVGRFVFGGLS